MITENQLEEICDELAETIDNSEGDLDVDTTIDAILAEHCRGTDVELVRGELLTKFNDIFKCNPFIYSENAEDDVVWDRENVLLDNLDDLEGLGLDDDIPLEDLEELL